MINVVITRTYKQDHTFSTMKIYKGKDIFDHLWTMERPWLDNKPFESCIPEGEYICKPYSSTKYYNVWEVKDVINRTHILFHSGNWAKDSMGCILPGMSYNQREKMVGSSKAAMSEMRSIIGKNEFKITIRSNEN